MEAKKLEKQINSEKNVEQKRKILYNRNVEKKGEKFEEYKVIILKLNYA